VAGLQTRAGVAPGSPPRGTTADGSELHAQNKMVRSMFRLLSEKAVDYEALAAHMGPAATAAAAATRPRRHSALDSQHSQPPHHHSSDEAPTARGRPAARSSHVADRCVSH
jgi:hypothetical protein